MAASSATVALSSSIVAAPSSLSSRTSFAPQVVSVAPCKTARRGVVTVRASASEEPKAVRRELLAGLVAAGAALAVAGSSIAATGPIGFIAAAGPGNDGPAITNKQADDLLKAGDDFTNNESPPRYGGERVGQQALKNVDKVAQQAGSGAVEGLQNNENSGSSAIDVAKQNVEKAGERLGDLFKPNKSGADLSSSATDAVEDAANNATGGVQDLLNNGAQKVKSDIDTASSKVKNDVATTQGTGSKVSNKAGNVLDNAQGKTSDAVEEGKGFFGDLKNKITDSIPK